MQTTIEKALTIAIENQIPDKVEWKKKKQQFQDLII